MEMEIVISTNITHQVDSRDEASVLYLEYFVSHPSVNVCCSE
jgi:hypothetical protein